MILPSPASNTARLWSITLAMLTPSTLADWAFKSRPDLSPPTLNISVSVPSALSPGYIFVSPRASRRAKLVEPYGPVQPGPYIFDSRGALVWSGVGSFSAATNNFRAARFDGRDVLVGFEFDATSRRTQFGQGRARILDQHYVGIKDVSAANGIVADKHEFQVLNERTALFVSYTPVPCDLAGYGISPNAQWILDGVFQEVDIESGRLIFEWRSLDHVSPSECIVPLSTPSLGSGLNSTDAIDYFHINSVDSDGTDYLVSGRRTSTIYKISGTTGHIIWRLGGKHSDFTFGPGAAFGLQHDARFIARSETGDKQTISLFDNSGLPSLTQTGTWQNVSSGKILVLDTRTWTANLVRGFAAPNDEFAFAMGNAQVLPNDNLFVNWGTAGAMTEFSPDGTALFHAHLDSGELFRNGRPASYRGFKFDWTGTPREDPAIVALTRGETTVVVYVSWNGDTETKSWQFWGVDGGGVEVWLGEEERSGFETGFYVHRGTRAWKGFWARAVGKDGKVLRASKMVAAQAYVYRSAPHGDAYVAAEGDVGMVHKSRKSEL